MRVIEFWQRVLAELEEGRAVYICLVVDQKKGSPGTTEARMVLTESGRQFGTIGGGIMERRVIDSAQKLLADGVCFTPRLKSLSHRKEARTEVSGLICGGAQTNLEAILPAADRRLVQRILSAAEGGTVAYVRFDRDGIRLCDAAESAGAGPFFVSKDSDEWHFRMPLINGRRIVIFGGGHCGAALAQLMWRLDYAVSVVEPRGELPTLETLPDGVRRIGGGFEIAAQSVDFPEETMAVVMTYSMATDIDSLAGIIPMGFKEIGLMGSPVKIAQIKGSLKSKGFDDLQIQKIRAPVGLNFNSDTPDEIAVSIAAQILLERRSSE